MTPEERATLERARTQTREVYLERLKHRHRPSFVSWPATLASLDPRELAYIGCSCADPYCPVPFLLEDLTSKD